VSRRKSAAIGNVVEISDAITKLCNMEELTKDKLAKTLAKKSVVC
jgi:hypothetical protein